MSGALRAQFELTLQDELSGPIEKAEKVVSGLEATLRRLGQNDAFDTVWEPVPRFTHETQDLAGALDLGTAAATGLGEGLGVTGASADTAALAIGRTALETTELSVALGRTTAEATGLGTALGRTGQDSVEAVSGLDALTAAADRAAVALDRVQGTGGGGGRGGRRGAGPSEPHEGRLGLLRTLGHGSREFGEASQEAMHHALGAAAAGYGLYAPVEALSDYQHTAVHMGITMGMSGAEDYAFAEDWQRYINGMARQYGQKSDDLMESGSFLSMEGYNKEKIRQFLPTIAKISTAYTAQPDAVGRTAFALEHSLGINADTLPRALAEVARTGKESALPMEELAPLFPQAAARAGSLGVQGLSGVADLAGMLAVIRKSVGTEGEAVTDVNAFMKALTTKHGQKALHEQLGIDIIHQIIDDQRKGRNPLTHVLGEVTAITDPEKRLRAISTIFGNQEDQEFATALAKNTNEFEAIRGRIAATTLAMIDTDFHTALTNSAKTHLDSFQDSVKQTERHIGHGFLPIMDGVKSGLDWINVGFEKLEKNHPWVATGIVGGGGGLMAAGVGIGALGFVGKPLGAGLKMLKPLMAPAGRLALRGLVGGLGLVVDALGAIGVVSGGTVLAVAAVAAALGIAGYETWKHWDQIKKGFADFEGWVGKWEERVGTSIGKAFHYFDSHMDVQSMSGPLVVKTSGPGWNGYVPPAQSPQHPPIQLHVSHDQGLHVQAMPHPTAQVHVMPSGGRMMVRP